MVFLPRLIRNILCYDETDYLETDPFYWGCQEDSEMGAGQGSPTHASPRASALHQWAGMENAAKELSRQSVCGVYALGAQP